MTEREYLVALYSFIPFGPARIKLLRKYFGSASKTWTRGKRELISIGLKEKLVNEFDVFRKKFDAKGYFNRLKKLSISFITIDDSAYPGNLLDLGNSPVVLYIKGMIKVGDSNAVAIVGSRKITSYGREVSAKFAGELASYGVTIISGLARGIDTSAHREALEVGGRTIAVLACGLDFIYPLENTQLANKIIDGHGAVISEYPLGYPAFRNNFANRNRIISGLSKAVVVIEGEKKSGTLLTASAAADQGRQVFAVPGQITSPMSGAPHFLIKNGAKMATGVSDILEELDLQLKVDREEVERVMPSGKNEAKLVEILANEPLHLDELARISGLPVNEISAKLTIMELKGMVKNMGRGVYKKC